VSAMSHAALLGALVWREVPSLALETVALESPIELEITWADDRRVEPSEVSVTPMRPTEEATVVSPLQQHAGLDEVREFFDGDVPTPRGDLKTFVRQSIKQAGDAASKRSPEDLLNRLDGLGGTLGRVSDEDRVQELAGRFGDWLNTTRRATEPAREPVAGRFDADSAQIHDVLREVDQDGMTRYFAILVDASGRTEKVPLDMSDGERLYKTMALIKKHPLLEAVYRDVVMAFLDKLAGGQGSPL
jgi:hypothetical protein